ncbi:phytoene/squalene synthase family protein [Pseudolysinimonas sp.]|uniref:phytoene/squalene synthase family protein n=1 Tax=Pseudolysinimonas sp. TaxID=2680009 RepID=UPI003782F338
MSRDKGGDGGPRLTLYDEVAQATASLVIRRYSTSFGMAARLLGAGIRQPVENIYALVRVADEIVDGGAEEAGLDRLATGRLLNAYEEETERALDEGYSADLVVHAFARTARAAGFGPELTKPFFASMRADLHETVHDAASFAEYVYGSAEVVGLMCLRVFLVGHERTPAELETLERGARALGAAFQKVNFLRDLAADHDKLGRSYFPGIDVSRLTDTEKLALVDDIDADLAHAAATLPLLPPSSRRAVALAHGLFAELSRRIRRTPASVLITTRVRVPDPVKLRIALAAATTTGGRA